LEAINPEAAIRLSVFIGVFAIMALWEVAAPRRPLTVSKGLRWYANIGIVVVNTLVARIVMPVLPIGMAEIAADRGWGLFNMVGAPAWLAVVVSFVLLDLMIYGQHVLVHKVPLLWRLHRMHHADLDFDVTTGARFHPLEILFSFVLKIAAVALLGAPALAVLIFEVVLNATAMFNHGNVRLPAAIDRVLRLFVVTPEMHRVHHSIKRYETDSNYGFNLPWWDRLFGTYRAQPADGHTDMTIGLPFFREPREEHLHRMLLQPFRDVTVVRSGPPRPPA
jgi:sterol desaturase/sphingolipid hydroxylase (fatty acid hydroxylase superfamily)